MLYCGNGHRTYLRVLVTGEDGILIADSKELPQDVVSAIAQDMEIGECPVCSGKIPLIPKNGQ